ncbi:MAG: Bax inhibitor-1/YccA family protein [Candidatus Omnitrophica bacterium]|nr:Bax inhibitor-1/YccA family protein [Candidatus Omnitrophota bacterium]
MRTANPALNANTFAHVPAAASGQAMTIQGTVNRSFILLAILVVTANWVWGRVSAGMVPQGLILVGALGGFVVALVTVFKKDWATVTAPLYAALEGLFVGGISAVFEGMYPGIVIQAVGLTFGTLGALLLAYTSRLIPVTQNFRLGIVAATGGICLFYIVAWIMSFFGVQMPLLHDSGPLGIGLSVVIVVIAALNLVLDFDFIEHASERGLPKYMEWYAAFGLMVTLIWLYIEILRLLSKVRSRR